MILHRATRPLGRITHAADIIRSIFPRALAVCSLLYGWVLMYFFNESPWASLAGLESESCRLYFIGGMLAGMLAGLTMTSRANVKATLIGTTAAASALALALRILAASRGAGIWGCAVFGLLAGGSFGGMIHIWIFAFPAVPRMLSVAMVHLSGGAVSMLLLFAAERFGPIAGMAIDLALPVAAIWLISDMDMGRVDDPSKALPLPFPGRLI